MGPGGAGQVLGQRAALDLDVAQIECDGRTLVDLLPALAVGADGEGQAVDGNRPVLAVVDEAASVPVKSPIIITMFSKTTISRPAPLAAHP